MITLNRLNKEPIIVNALHVLTVECIPETLLTMTGGEKIMVEDSAHDVVSKITFYLRSIGTGPMIPAIQPRSARNGGRS